MTNPTIGKLREILTDLTNFMVWESQQEWKPDYDRVANRQNSQTRAEQAIIAWALEIVGQDEQYIKQIPRTAEGNVHVHVRNQLRAEIRAKLTGGTE